MAHLRKSKSERHPCCGNLFGDHCANSGDLYGSSVHIPLSLLPGDHDVLLSPAEGCELSGTELSASVSSVKKNMYTSTHALAHIVGAAFVSFDLPPSLMHTLSVLYINFSRFDLNQ